MCWKLGKRGRKQIGNWREAHFVLLDCSLGGKASPGGDLFGRSRSRWPPKTKTKTKTKTKASPGGDLFGWGRSRWPRAGEEGGDSGEISINGGQRCFKAGLHTEQKNTVDARKEESFNKNGMTTAKT